jgi:hypothetical protein
MDDRRHMMGRDQSKCPGDAMPTPRGRHQEVEVLMHPHTNDVTVLERHEQRAAVLEGLDGG